LFQERNVYFTLTACGRPQGAEGSPAHVDASGQRGGGQKPDFFVDVINGWPLGTYLNFWCWPVFNFARAVQSPPI